MNRFDALFTFVSESNKRARILEGVFVSSIERS